MNGIFSLIFVCFCMNLINVCNAQAYDHSQYATDMELSFKDQFNLHHAFVIEKSKWMFGIVSFKMDEAFNSSERAVIINAMYEIERLSCIRFEAHDPGHGPNYVMIKKGKEGEGCSADLGCKNEGEQDLGLGDGCVELGVVIHELLHTIGFNHHQCRSDRDHYIDVHWNNIIDNETYNFETQISYDTRVMYVTPFDFHSIMLYRADTYSKNNKSVLTPRTEDDKIEPFKNGLTKYDQILLNRFYDCESVDKIKSTIFYENEKGIWYPQFINYHEIARAIKFSDSEHFVDDQVTDEYEKTDEKLDDPNEKEENENLAVDEDVDEVVDEGVDEGVDEDVDEEDNNGNNRRTYLQELLTESKLVGDKSTMVPDQENEQENLIVNEDDDGYGNKGTDLQDPHFENEEDVIESRSERRERLKENERRKRIERVKEKIRSYLETHKNY